MMIRCPRILSTIGAAALLAVLLAYGSPARAAQHTADEPELKDLVLTGDKVCTRCHDEADSPEQLAIGRTKHGTRADGRTPTCTSCHGESQRHIDNPDGTDVRPKPERSFGKGSATPPDQRNAACLDCHEGGERMLWQASTHQSRDVTCDSCHRVHDQKDPVRVKLEQAEVCFDCHTQQRTEVRKPSRHPVEEGKVVCSDCHSPHGSAGPKLMARDTVNDTCFQCHMEKRGPFIWNHQPVTEDCSYCHNPHGTTVANLLKWRPPFLCQQCHEATSHRGAIPSLVGGGGTSGRNVTLARGCVNCHTNIHGGNNSVDGSASRSFRR